MKYYIRSYGSYYVCSERTELTTAVFLDYDGGPDLTFYAYLPKIFNINLKDLEVHKLCKKNLWEF